MPVVVGRSERERAAKNESESKGMHSGDRREYPDDHQGRRQSGVEAFHPFFSIAVPA